jgi:predicted MPP superfamily phosphohydrolase
MMMMRSRRLAIEDHDDDDDDDIENEHIMDQVQQTKLADGGWTMRSGSTVLIPRRCRTALVLLSIIAIIVSVKLSSPATQSASNSTNAPSSPVYYNSNQDSPTIRLELTKKDNSFKILQLADLHMGEDTDSGPERDRRTWRALDRIIVKEDPDLIVLSGDQLSAGHVDANATAYYKILGNKLSEYNRPWALIFGNHDDAPYQRRVRNGIETVIQPVPAQTSREELLRVDRSFPLSLTGSASGNNIFGTSNYALDVYTPQGLVAAKLVFLDTGGGSLPKRVDRSQLAWLTKQASSRVPWVVFAHIPTQDFAFNGPLPCSGMHEGGLAPVQMDAGLVPALVGYGNVHILAVGHNHGNDYCCRRSDVLHLCFGRQSGYGGNGRWERGARVYELVHGSSFQWRSWVRMEDGVSYI